MFIGCDASKGYADFCCIDDQGEVKGTRPTLDDTASGRQAFQRWCTEIGAGIRAVIGVESSGGVERNWLRHFRDLGLEAICVNPLAVSRFRSVRLHESVTDASSALAIAQFLRALSEPERKKALEDGSGDSDELRRVHTVIQSHIRYAAKLKSQLQALLVNSHPELVRYCLNGIPKWMLSLLKRYPTIDALRAASVAELSKLPFVTEKRAAHILESVQQSTASAVGRGTSITVKHLATEIVRASKEVDALETQLLQMMGDSRPLQLYASIPGVGAKTAMYLTLLLGNCSRFHSEKAVIAFVGLDCRVHQSGDSEKKNKISKRGDSRARGLLFQCAKAAVRLDTPFRKFYARLLGRGKCKMVALTAVMAKLLRVAYICQLKQAEYKPENHVIPETTEPRRSATLVAPRSLQAPISRREAAKRKRQLAPRKNEVEPQASSQLPGSTIP